MAREQGLWALALALALTAAAWGGACASRPGIMSALPRCRTAMRLRGGVEFEDVTDADAEMHDAADVGSVLEQAVKKLKADPGLLHAPELTVFRTYLASLGATLPPKPATGASSAGSAAGSAEPEPSEEEVEEEEEEEEEMQDDDIVAEADADLDTPQPPPDTGKEPSDDDFARSAELKNEAMEAAAAGDAEKAAGLWSEVIALAPNANVVASRGMCYLKMRKPLAAIRDADNALGVWRVCVCLSVSVCARADTTLGGPRVMIAMISRAAQRVASTVQAVGGVWGSIGVRCFCPCVGLKAPCLGSCCFCVRHCALCLPLSLSCAPCLAARLSLLCFSQRTTPLFRPHTQHFIEAFGKLLPWCFLVGAREQGLIFCHLRVTCCIGVTSTYPRPTLAMYLSLSPPRPPGTQSHNDDFAQAHSYSKGGFSLTMHVHNQPSIPTLPRRTRRGVARWRCSESGRKRSRTSAPDRYECMSMFVLVCMQWCVHRPRAHANA